MIPREGSHTLGWQGLRCLPTPAGWATLALVGVLVLLARWTGLDALRLLAVWLAAILLGSVWLACRTLLGLRLEWAAAHPVFAGQPAELPVVLANPAMRARTGLALGWDGQPAVVQLAVLAAASRRTCGLDHSTGTRGWQPLPPLRISSCQPFGLVRAWACLSGLPAVRVWPCPLESGLPLAAGRHPGGQGDEWQELLPWRPGQPASRVAWKIRAHGGPLVQSRFGDSAGPAVEWLDWDTSPEPDLDRRAGLLAGRVVQLAQQPVSLRLRLAGRELAGGPARLLDALADAGREAA